jgi:hypothetical protein
VNLEDARKLEAVSVCNLGSSFSLGEKQLHGCLLDVIEARSYGQQNASESGAWVATLKRTKDECACAYFALQIMYVS